MKMTIYLLVLALLIANCSPTPMAETTPPEVPTETEQIILPTNTIQPTLTPLPPTDAPEPTATLEPTATPEYQIFRDDFTGTLQPGWRWENEKPDRWSITEDGWLQIVGEDATLLAGEAQSNVLWRDLPEGDFAIVVHLKANPYADFHQAAIFVYEDIDNYITINHGYCSFCVSGGAGIYMDYKVSGAFGNYFVSFTEEDLYLKLEVKDGIVSGFYSLSPDEWTRLGRFGNIFEFKTVGIGVSNCGSEANFNAVLTGLYDYFEIIKP
jgi:hypothetical protein